MLTKLKSWLPSIIHIASVLIVFLAPSVQASIQMNPKLSGAVIAAWGVVLQWARRPKV